MVGIENVMHSLNSWEIVVNSLKGPLGGNNDTC